MDAERITYIFRARLAVESLSHADDALSHFDLIELCDGTPSDFDEKAVQHCDIQPVAFSRNVADIACENYEPPFEFPARPP